MTALDSDLAAAMPPIRVLLVGDVQRPEFREAAATLGACASAAAVAGVAEAESALASGEISPAAIVVAQSFPGQFSHESIERLQRAAPLTRILGLLGSWCEGEPRTGRPWPASARLYWHQWPARAPRLFRRMNAGKVCSFSLPATATEEERLLADLEPTFAMPAGGGACLGQTAAPGQLGSLPAHKGLAVVRCRWFAVWEMIAEACRHRGLSAVWRRDDSTRLEGAAAAIFDCDRLDANEFGALRRMADSLRPAPVIALASFPRVEDQHRALAAGAAAVVSKPFAWDDLFAEIEGAA